MTLTEFLLARLAEDESVARECDPNGSLYWGGPQSGLGICDEQGDHVAATRARVLDDVESKRAIVSECASVHGGPAAHVLADIVLEALAHPYADHPDFDPAWTL